MAGTKSAQDNYTTSGATPYQYSQGPDVSQLLQAHLAAGGTIDPGVMQALAAQAAGQGPSAAQAALTQGSNQAMNQTAALAAQNHGNQNPGEAQRMAIQAQAGLGQQAGLNSATLAAQQAQQAQGLYGQLAGQQAGLNQQTSLANAGAQNQMATNLAQAQIGQNQFYQGGQASEQDQANQAKLGFQTALNNQAIAGQQGIENGAFGLASAGAGALSKLSDEDAKENVTDGDSDIEAFMSKLGKGPTTVDPKKFMAALKAHSYNYKPGMGEGSGRTTSPMAQEVEQAAPGAVSQRQDGMKEVDYGKLQGNFAAALGNLHERLTKLEGPYDDENE